MISCLILAPSEEQRQILHDACVAVMNKVPGSGVMYLKESVSVGTYAVFDCPEPVLVFPHHVRAIIRPNAQYVHPLVTNSSQVFDFLKLNRLLRSTKLPHYTYLALVFGAAMRCLLPDLPETTFEELALPYLAPEIEVLFRRAFSEGMQYTGGQQGVTHDLFVPVGIRWEEKDWAIPAEAAEEPEAAGSVSPEKKKSFFGLVDNSSADMPRSAKGKRVQVTTAEEWLGDEGDSFDEVFVTATKTPEPNQPAVVEGAPTVEKPVIEGDDEPGPTSTTEREGDTVKINLS